MAHKSTGICATHDQLVDLVMTIRHMGLYSRSNRHIGRVCGISRSTVKNIYNSEEGRNWCRIFNGKTIPDHSVVAEYVSAHLANEDHGDECIIYPYYIAHQYPSYKNKNLCWIIYEQSNSIDVKFRRLNKLVHICGNKTCINRNHFYAAPKKNPENRKPDSVILPPVEDPLLKPWR